jgi:serine/threonine protein kinase
MLSGNTVFTGSSSEVMYKHVDSKLPDLDQYLPEMPDEIVKLIEKMMAKKPEDRPTCDDLFEQLEYLKTYCESEERPAEFSGGKTTLFNAFNVGRLRIARLERENSKLKNRERLMRGFTFGLAGVTAILTAVVIWLIFKMYIS